MAIVEGTGAGDELEKQDKKKVKYSEGQLLQGVATQPGVGHSHPSPFESCSTSRHEPN